jgi:hypothetical protein
VNRRNPFDALGLPSDPDLTDDQIHAAWRTIAAATHPDRPDGGDLPRYTAASAAYTELSTRWGRTEAYADIIEDLHDTTPLPPLPAGFENIGPPPATFRPLLMLPERIWHGHKLRLALRAIIAAALSLALLALIPNSPAAPADVIGCALWFVLTGRSDLAPPPRR